jgi:uncharacterized membrane protein YphA (DoxX/SURF4 family)
VSAASGSAPRSGHQVRLAFDAAHGTQKLFGWFGGHGFAATTQGFDRVGFRPGPLMALLAGVGEAGGGVLLALGLLTPLGAAAGVGVMLNASSVHLSQGFWNNNPRSAANRGSGLRTGLKPQVGGPRPGKNPDSA